MRFSHACVDDWELRIVPLSEARGSPMRVWMIGLLFVSMINEFRLPHACVYDWYRLRIENNNLRGSPMRVWMIGYAELSQLYEDRFPHACVDDWLSLLLGLCGFGVPPCVCG